jgi:hypothetical protein
LYEFARQWLKEGSIDGDPTPPGAIIVSERQRTPLTGDFHILSDDCPICRMLAEDSEGTFGPMFRNFDGHHLELDDEFAFSLCETREEWEEEQERYRKMNEEFEAEQKRKAKEDASAEFDSAWQTSYVADDAPLNAMTLAFRLSEIVGDLQAAGGQKADIENVNEAFESCRNAAFDPPMLQTAKSQLVEVLEQIAAEHTALTPKIADFQSLLDQWARQSSDDMDIPF